MPDSLRYSDSTPGVGIKLGGCIGVLRGWSLKKIKIFLAVYLVYQVYLACLLWTVKDKLKLSKWD